MARVNSAGTDPKRKGLHATLIQSLKEAVRDMKYGSITLVIQDGVVIQIDRVEKIRIN